MTSRLAGRFDDLWSSCAAHRDRFLSAAYQETVDRLSVVETREGLDWIERCGFRTDLRPVLVHVTANFVAQGLMEPLELLLVLLRLNPTLVLHPPYRPETDVAHAQLVLALVDFQKYRTPSGEFALGPFIDWIRRLKQEAPDAKIAVTEPYFPEPGRVLLPVFEAERFAAVEQSVAATTVELGATLIRWRAALEAAGVTRTHRVSHYVHYDKLLTHEGLAITANVLARYAAALLLPRKKVICLDADNTLWHGLVGEDGADGILYQPDSPVGRCFHRALMQLRRSMDAGVLLALVSKNDEKTVLGVLARPDFPLKREDFSAVRINWDHKSQNIRDIADELNLGLDSFVLIDDSEAELFEVGSALPDVETVRVPTATEKYVERLLNIPGLDRLAVTAEDRSRKQEYRAQAERRRVQLESPDTFPEKLRIQIEVRSTTLQELPRVAQLFMKTNQFSFSSHRPQEELLHKYLDDRSCRLHSVYYRDIFGDSGLVGAAIFKREELGWLMRNFVMSCRVLGRGVEEAVLTDWSRAYWPLRVSFERSGRNTVAERTLTALGWRNGEPLDLPASLPQVHLLHT